MIRLLHDWLLVRVDPLPEMIGSLVIPDIGPGAVRQRTGVIAQAGPGRWAKNGLRRLPLGVAVGDKVTFFREHLEHQQGKQLTRLIQQLDESTALIRVPDILYVEGA